MKRVVNAIIKNKQGKFLLVKRKSGIHAGKWAFPGGIIEDDESIEKALKREVKEETNLKLRKIIKKISSYKYKRENNEETIGECYLVDVENENVKINEEISLFKWVSIEQLEKLDLAPGIEEEALLTF